LGLPLFFLRPLAPPFSTKNACKPQFFERSPLRSVTFPGLHPPLSLVSPFALETSAFLLSRGVGEFSLFPWSLAFHPAVMVLPFLFLQSFFVLLMSAPPSVGKKGVPFLSQPPEKTTGGSPEPPFLQCLPPHFPRGAFYLFFFCFPVAPPSSVFSGNFCLFTRLVFFLSPPC